jgi:aminoglycoside phosphotransferase family enzyme/predicted kinase
MVEPCGSRVRLRILGTGWRDRAILAWVVLTPTSGRHRLGVAVRILLTDRVPTRPTAAHNGPCGPECMPRVGGLGSMADAAGGTSREPADVDPTGSADGAYGPDALSGPEVSKALVVETHISTLFFVGDLVFKLRKPVEFGFLDFRSRSSRKEDCEREVSLNRRLAPDVYLGVADLSMGDRLLDHMVVMKRMPRDRQLAALAGRGEDLDPWLRQVTDLLIAFHSRAQRSPEISAAATDQALSALWQENFNETDPFRGSILDDHDETAIRAHVGRWIAGRRPLLDARIASDCVCDGHGDLQAEDIFCLDDGVRILDCIEFSDRLRHGDVCADVAFLAMDLERLGHRGAADRFLVDYQRLADDPFPDTLIHHYTALRAYIRAKVACLRTAQDVDGAREEARQLQRLALDHLLRARVRLVLVGGLPGCGKTTLATGLAAATGWTVLRSDEIRAQMGDPAIDSSRIGTTGYREGRYRPEVTATVYGELLGLAEQCLGLGRSVILDASWADDSWRAAARSLADRTCSDLAEFRCEAPPHLAAGRIARRLADRSDVSEATPEIGRTMSRAFDPWPPATVVDTGALAPGEAVTLAVDVLC